jgi:hypothetical protein
MYGIVVHPVKCRGFANRMMIAKEWRYLSWDKGNRRCSAAILVCPLDHDLGASTRLIF